MSRQSNKESSASVDTQCGTRRSKRHFSKGIQTMTIRTRLALGISAAALSFSLALAPAAFADDMSKDGMKKETMSKDGMKKDTMSKDGMKKDDGMMKKH
jgi:pentapeptide MXKDX repeat protein